MVKKQKPKCLVMFSGGLDSRLAIKLMQERGFEVQALFFKLPFGTGCCNEGCSFNFSQTQGIKLNFIDCTTGKLLQEYLKIIKDAKHGRGAGMNPCVDCRIFMFKKAKEFADKEKIKFIVTGEVVGQRPMSQQKKQIELIEKEVGLNGRIIRPLIELGISGRKRDKQIELANKFGIKYPHPAGGCLLCEKALKNRLKYLLERGLDEQEIKFISVGRHFLIDNCWVVIGRSESENKIIENVKNREIIISDYAAPSAVIFDKADKVVKSKVNELIKSYSKDSSFGDRKNFESFKF